MRHRQQPQDQDLVQVLGPTAVKASVAGAEILAALLLNLYPGRIENTMRGNVGLFPKSQPTEIV